MKESGYYPPGAEFDPNAPYNQPQEPDPVQVVVDVTETLTKKVIVTTDKFMYDYDDSGEIEKVELTCSYKDVEKLVQKQHKSILQLLNELSKYINGELICDNLSKSRMNELLLMLDDCKDWESILSVEEYELEN